jgi:hypothetical protein
MEQATTASSATLSLSREQRPRETALPRLWSVSALARHLNLSRPTIYARMADGTFEVVIAGGVKRITERSVLNYLRVLRRLHR